MKLIFKIFYLPSELSEKLKDFSMMNDIPQSHIINDIILDKSIIIDPKNLSEIQKVRKKDSKQEHFNEKIPVYIAPESKILLKNMVYKYFKKTGKRITESEIVREKLRNADLTLYKFKKRGEK